MRLMTWRALSISPYEAGKTGQQGAIFGVIEIGAFLERHFEKVWRLLFREMCVTELCSSTVTARRDMRDLTELCVLFR